MLGTRAVGPKKWLHEPRRTGCRLHAPTNCTTMRITLRRCTAGSGTCHVSEDLQPTNIYKVMKYQTQQLVTGNTLSGPSLQDPTKGKATNVCKTPATSDSRSRAALAVACCCWRAVPLRTACIYIYTVPRACIIRLVNTHSLMSVTDHLSWRHRKESHSTRD